MTLHDFPAICGEEIPHFLIFDFTTAPPLLFYSYIPIALSALMLSYFIMRKDVYSLRSKLLVALSAFFALWMINILVQWVASYHTALLYGWQLTALFEVALYVAALYFYCVFILGKDISLTGKYLLATPLLITALLTPTVLNIASYDIYWCEGDLGYLWTAIYYFLEPLVILLIPIIGIVWRKHYQGSLPELFITTIGLTAFLAIFYISNVAGEITQTYQTNFVGPIGLLIFLLILLYSMVKFKLFKTQVMATEALVATLVASIFGLGFIRTIENVRVASILTALAALFLGYLLIASVRREVKQREEIEQLAKKLKRANKKLKVLDQMKSEFVSIASHQLRSPLTSIRGYASMLLEGSYGKVPTKATKAIERIGESSRLMSQSVEDYLNVSRIQAGNMSYDYTDFNLRDLVETVADEMRGEAVKKGLLLVFKTDMHSKGIVHADLGKSKQIIQNLIDNALKYTPNGRIEIKVRDTKKPKKIFVEIKDTGIGMNEDTIDDVFGKFERAHNANEVNVTGTGLGLFVADKMATDMGGDVSAKSKGEGKGSTFTLELPLHL